jgi:homeobox protein YOX1/YHP1
LSNYTTTAYPSRTSSPVGVSPDSPEESRRLPPPTTNVERWPGTYMQTTSNYQTGVRSSPTYAHVYPNYNVSSPTTTYSYPISPQEHTSQPQPQLAALQASYGEMDPQRSEPRPSSPYNRNAANTQQPSNVSVPPPPPPTANTTEEPTIKKKRKRADANQLKVLNETYARTAFPSTEERLALAKLLDMSPRSVQIW